MKRLNGKFIWAGVASVIIGSALGAMVFLRAPASDQILEITAQAAMPTDLHVYYDIGGGFNPRHLRMNKLSTAPTPATLCYCLPGRPIRRLRIDPGTSPSQLTIQRISITPDDDPPILVNLSSVKPMHQIEWLRSSDQGLMIQLKAGADDPMLLIENLPNTFGSRKLQLAAHLFIGGAMACLFTLCVWALMRVLSPVGRNEV